MSSPSITSSAPTLSASVPSVPTPPPTRDPAAEATASLLSRLRDGHVDHREPGSAPRWRIGVGAVVLALVVLLGVGVAVSALAGAGAAQGLTVDAVTGGESGGGTAPDPAGVAVSTTAPPTVAASTVFVHVLGQVAKPGVYEVPSGSRVIDAVSAAGGFGAKAEQSSLNLARPVVDGEQIVVLAVGESPAPTVSPSGASPDPAAPVDLNTADEAALEQLPGVGPATAAAIVKWRDANGRFASVDDLLAVSGIGEKKLERMRDAVTAR